MAKKSKKAAKKKTSNKKTTKKKSNKKSSNKKDNKRIVIKYDAGCSYCNRFVIKAISKLKGVNYSLQPLTEKEVDKMKSWRVVIDGREYFRGKAYLKLMCERKKIYCWMFNNRFIATLSDKIYDFRAKKKHRPIMQMKKELAKSKKKK